MTIKGKARAYDEALEDMRAIYPNLKGNAKLAVEHVFPELAESEDERIRKRLIEYFEGFRMGNAEVKWEGLTVQEVLAWLEKREEQKPVDFPTTDEEVNEFLETHSKVEVPEKYKTPDFVFSKQEYESYPIISKDTTSVKPAEWSEDFDKEVEKIHKRYPEVSFAKLTRIAYHFSKWANRRKDIEWSEADEEMLDAMIDIVSNSLYEPLCPREGMLAWLKSLPERFNLEPKEGWNEEDEENMQAIVETIKRHWLTLPGNTLIAWLKSLRPVSKESLQPHWKPSEEQMNALYNVINPCDHVDKKALESLYEQLKSIQ